MSLIYTNSAFILIIILLLQCYYSYGACPSLISNETLTVTCKHNNKTLNNCDNPMEGTEAYLTCNLYYEEITLKENPKRLCREGKWDGSIPQCYPICGEMRINKSSNTENVEDILLDYPWHVGVYDDNKAFLCGGTLIAMNIVLTVAYCVTLYNVDNAKMEPAEKLFVASGKYYFTYDDNRDKFAQNSEVGTVHFPEEYKGSKNNFAFDIAILVLTYSFFPSEVVQPVCMNFASSSQDSLLQDSGIVIGLGYMYKEEQLSELLKAFSVLYIPHNQCYWLVKTHHFELYVTFDKICGSYLDNNNGSLTLCNGDFGSGLVLKNKINGRYYISSILSSTELPRSVTSCNQFSLYTAIYEHQSFIENNTENIEMKNCALPSYPSNGEYVFLNTNITYKFGDLVPTYSKLALTCNVGYNFSSPAAKQYYCSRKGQWSPALTGCTKIDADQRFQKSTAVDYTYIILILVAIIIIIVVALVGVILYHFKFKQRWQLLRDIKLAGLHHFHNGNLKRFNPELDIGGQAEILPYNNNFEFSRDNLKLGKQLGSGAFGIVMQADAFGIIADEEKTVVAVKTAKNMADHSHLKALISELKIMVHLGQHLNVVNLLGACTQNIAKRELLVIVEYCQFGNLYNYLLQNRENYIDQINRVNEGIDYYSCGPKDLANVLAVTDYLSTQRETENINPIYTKDLVSWSFQVARGMEYLASRKILHGDLAARNILLADNNIVKICDFGLAKRMYKSMNYKKAKDCPLPMKWMAIESIRDQVFSTESDVWSFGIVLWEFFSLAQTPYPGMEADEKLYYKLLNGYKMELPPYAPREMYKIMCDCWSINPASRPCFNELAGRVGLMLEENVRQHYIDLNDPYLVMNLKRINENQTDYLGMLSPFGFQQRSIPYNGINTKDILNDQPVGNTGYLCLISRTDPAMSKTVNSLNNDEVAELSSENLDVDE